MRKILLCIMMTIGSFTGLYSQTFNLTVVNGYGSGKYQVGDTIHIWSEACDNTKTFSQWTGDTQYLQMPNEWHTTLIMPNKNISVTSVTANIPAYTIKYEQIMGTNNLKNVYSCFPPNLKGVIYLFHGTGGNASNWINSVENRSFINAAIADGYGIVVTEAEEITLNKDLNGDGNLRWLPFPMDTINGIDYRNISILTNTFISRGNMSKTTPRFSVGMSNGGAFSAAISYIYNYQAGVSYCASSVQAIFSARNNPFAFRMAKYDDEENVGPEGNYQAWQNDSILATRTICHDYKILDRQPIYPERFARIPGISVVSSQAIFNDLSKNSQLDSHNYAIYSNSIQNNVASNPSLYPNIMGLTTAQRLAVLDQISVSNAEHKFYSDYNFETLDFFNKLCSTTVGVSDVFSETQNLNLYPNPTNRQIQFNLSEGIYSIVLVNNFAQRVIAINNATGLTTVDVSRLSGGIYFIKAASGKRIFTAKFVKE